MAAFMDGVRAFFKEQRLTDCQFEVVDLDEDESRTIGAHKLVLAMHSPVFEAMFYGELKEMMTVRITDIKFDVFKKFLR